MDVPHDGTENAIKKPFNETAEELKVVGPQGFEP
jgi:hypothetical protein